MPKVDIEKAKEFFAKLRDATPKQERPSVFMPFVMIRSYAGDKGIRPLSDSTIPFWESPDIWTTPGDPVTAPEIPPNQGGQIIVGQPNTVYAHVWNLGRAPIAGVKVEWYWFNASLGIDGAYANLIGSTGAELAPAGFPGCHKLVKCPQAWLPIMENGGHECLIARVSAFGDPLNSANPWDAWTDRHVAQKNITVVAAQADVNKLIKSLDATRPVKSTVRLFQIGAEAAPSLALTATNLTVDPAVKTSLLAELKPDDSLIMSPLPGKIPRIMPHDLLNLGNKPAIPATRIQPTNLDLQPHLLYEAANVQTLLHHGSLLSPELMQQLDILPLPKKREAQVLRIVSYVDDKPSGGYTIIVTDAVKIDIPSVGMQENWRWCNKCQGMFFAGNPSQGVCPAGGVHDHSGSGNYSLIQNTPSNSGQQNWRWCNKCQGLFFAGNPSQGACPAGGVHDHSGSGNYSLIQNTPSDPGQHNWRWCNKCQGLFFAGNPSKGVCPAGGAHDYSSSGDYSLMQK